ncbi:MAG: monooxygenase [Arcobacteraceae bacterium]
MKHILQIDFPHDGAFHEALTNAFIDLADDIKTEDGLIWKIWTENEETKEAGGIYLFDSKESAEKYAQKHLQRLRAFDYTEIRAKIFEVNEALSNITKAKLD